MIKFKTQIKKTIPQSQFSRNVGILIGGTAGAQLLMILAAPILTRLYNPEEFGLLAVYVSLLVIFSVIACLRYEFSIPLPVKKKDAAHITVLCFIILLVTTTIITTCVILAKNNITKSIGAPELANYLWLLPVGVFMAGLYNIFNYWAIRTKEFNTIAKTRIRQSITTLSIQLISFKLGPIALLVGHTIGQSIGSLTLAKTALRNPEFNEVSRAGLKKVLIRYRRFPIFDIWYGILVSISSQLPPIFFTIFFGSQIAGFYVLTYRVLAMPMSVIGSAIANVFLSTAAEKHRRKQLDSTVENIFIKLTNIAIPPLMIVFIMGPELFSIVFGKEWVIAGEFAKYMSIWIFMQFVTSPLTTLFGVMGKQLQGTLFQVLIFTIRTTSILIGFWLDNIYTTILLFSLGSAIGYLIMSIWLITKTNASILKIGNEIVKCFTFSFLASLPLIIANNTTEKILILIPILFLSIILLAFQYWIRFIKNN